MKKIFLIVIFLQIIFLTNTLFSQTKSKIGEILKSKFENFQYEEIIAYSDSILKYSESLTRDDSISIFYYRAISAFNLWDKNLSEENFKKILSIDKNFALDSNEVSPKIISFFDEIKKREFENTTNKVNQTAINEKSPSELSLINEYKKSITTYREAVWKNLVFPGWGQLVLNQKSKGIIFAASFTVALISSVYFYFDTNSKEKAYLSETDPEKIKTKYSAYNNSYRLRNISFASLAAIYFYSQFDILTYPPINLSTSFSMNEDLKINKSSFNLSLKFAFK